MFCSQCGNTVSEGEVFCHTCGAKIVSNENSEAAGDVAVAVEIPRTVSSAPTYSGSASDFREFVNEQVRATTKFQSAEDLLKKSKPWMFAIICVGVLAIAGLISGGLLGLLILGGFIGYIIVFLASGIIRANYSSKYYGNFTGDIDVENLIAFLSEYLPQIYPHFHGWGYMTTKGGIGAMLENAFDKKSGRISLCCEFGEKRKTLAVIYLRQKQSEGEATEKSYVYAVDAVKKGFLIDGRAAGFLGHGTLIKTAPILHAAMEYYLKQR